MNKDIRPQLNQLVQNLTRTSVTTQELFGKDGKDIDLGDIRTLKDQLSTYYYLFGSYPNGFDEDLYNAINVLGSLHMINDYDNQYNVLRVSKMIESVYNKFDAYFNKTNLDLKYYAMSAHDDNITPL